MVGGVVVGRPLEGKRLRWAVFKDEELVLRAEELADAAWEEFRAGDRGHDFRTRTAVGRVARHVAREWRGDEGRTLVRNPVAREHPAGAGVLVLGIARSSRPTADCDLALVTGEFLVALASCGGCGGDDFNQARLEVEAVCVESRLRRIRALATLRHVANRADWPHRVVVSLQAPRGDCRIVQRTVERDVHLDVPLEFAELRPLATEAPFERRVIGHHVCDFVPVARRRGRVRAVCPELREAARPVAALDDVGWVRLARHRVDRVPGAVVCSKRIVPKYRRRDIHRHAVVRRELAREPNDVFMSQAPRRVAHAVQYRRRIRDRKHAGTRRVHLRRLNCERRDRTPERCDLRRKPARNDVAVLIDKKLERQRLIARWVRDRRVERHRDDQRFVHIEVRSRRLRMVERLA